MGLSIVLIMRARGNGLWWSIRRAELAFWRLTYDRRRCRRCNW